MKILMKILTSSLAIFFTAWLLKSGITINDYPTAVILAIVLAILNTFLKPLLVFLTIPFTIVTFGLFLLVINAMIILIASSFVPGFKVEGFWWALLFSIIVTLVNSVLQGLAKPEKNKR
jgi:putative membrane protein